MKTYFLFGIAFFLLFAACEDPDLDKSIFVEDKIYQGLPEYSEWGLNTFGAYFDRKIMVSSSSYTPAKFVSNASSTSFILEGVIKTNEVSYLTETMQLTFELGNFTPIDYTGLLALEGQSFNFADAGNQIALKIGGVSKTVSVVSGQLEFKRVQHLFVDKEAVEAIVSGLFKFQLMVDGSPVAIANGRFDFGIAEANFYLNNSDK